jgi:hypothetical protein
MMYDFGKRSSLRQRKKGSYYKTDDLLKDAGMQHTDSEVTKPWAEHNFANTLYSKIMQ